MISKKNVYSLENTKNFFKEYPIILIYQHNNLTVKQRIDLKVQLQTFNNIKTLTVKNSIVDRLCFSSLQNLLQGPIILVGCHNLEELKYIWGILKTSPSFLFVGSEFNNKIYTHLDLKKF